MTKISKEALKILAERTAKKINDSIRNKPLPKNITDLIKKSDAISSKIKKLEAEYNDIVNQINVLGYARTYNGYNGKYIFTDKKFKSVSNLNIYQDIVLLNEFNKKDLAEIEKELIAKYS
jgi:hypothetical protein